MQQVEIFEFSWVWLDIQSILHSVFYLRVYYYMFYLHVHRAMWCWHSNRNGICCNIGLLNCWCMRDIHDKRFSLKRQTLVFFVSTMLSKFQIFQSQLYTCMVAFLWLLSRRKTNHLMPMHKLIFLVIQCQKNKWQAPKQTFRLVTVESLFKFLFHLWASVCE